MKHCCQINLTLHYSCTLVRGGRCPQTYLPMDISLLSQEYKSSVVLGSFDNNVSQEIFSQYQNNKRNKKTVNKSKSWSAITTSEFSWNKHEYWSLAFGLRQQVKVFFKIIYSNNNEKLLKCNYYERSFMKQTRVLVFGIWLKSTNQCLKCNY